MNKKPKKSFNAEIDDLLDGLNLPSDEELREETRREKISLKGKGKIFSEETRRKMSEQVKNRPIEYRKKLSQAAKNRSEDLRKRVSESRKGKTHTKETRRKISEANKIRPLTGNLKSMITPFGIFASIKEAGKYEEHITGKKFNPNRYTKLLRDSNSGYKRISQEEYTKLTGKEI